MRTTAPPSAPESEQQIIGALLLDPSRFDQISQRVNPGDFFDPYHTTAYRVIRSMHLAGESIDSGTVMQRLNESGRWSERFTAATYLYGIGEEFVSLASLDFHIGRVLEAADLRKYVEIGDEIHEAVNARNPSGEIRQFLRVYLDCLRDRSSPVDSTAILDDLADRILRRETPARFRVADDDSALVKFSIGPGQVILVGAPPAEGKTALVCQLVFNALGFSDQDHLRALIANVEMSPDSLLTRQLARFSGVGHNYLLHRDYDQAAAPRIESAAARLRPIVERIEFMRPPFTLDRTVRQAETAKADIVVVDYVQRFQPEKVITDLRAQTNAAMDACRRIGDQGRAVIAVSAMSRQRDSSGSTYNTGRMGLASFRESSELEYGADAAWVLSNDDGKVSLRCVKNRHGSRDEIALLFDGARQQFTDDRSAEEWTG